MKKILFIVQLLSRVWLFATAWIAAHQASLSFTISQSLLKLMVIESVIPPKHLILCHTLWLLPSIFPSIRVFPVNQLYVSGGQSIGVLASASFLPVNIQGWFPLRLTGLISLQSKGPSRVFSSTTIWKYQFFSKIKRKYASTKSNNDFNMSFYFLCILYSQYFWKLKLYLYKELCLSVFLDHF